MHPSPAPKNLATIILAVLVITVALTVFLAWLGLSTIDLPFQLKNKDFANYWMAGRLSLSGDAIRLFGPPETYFAAMKAIFGPDYPWHNWSYPPNAVPFLVPLGFLDFLPAMALFLGLTLALYLASIGTLDIRWSPMEVMLLAPFIVTNLVATQNGFLTAALILSGLALRERRPVLAGICFGLLTFKPQLGFLLPILLIAEGRWRVFVAAATSAIGLAILSILYFGIESWTAYFRFVAPYQTEVMNTLGGDFAFLMGSAFGSARSLGLPADTALLIHAPFAILGVALFAICLWKLKGLQDRAFALLLATLIITPYSVSYDFGAIATLAAVWPLAGRRDDLPAYLRIIMILTAILPIAMMPLGTIGLPIAPLLLIAALTALLASRGAFARSAQAAA